MRRAPVLVSVILTAGCALPGPAPMPAHLVGPAAEPSEVASGHTPSAGGRLAAPGDVGRAAPARYSVLGCIRSPDVDAWERRLAREERAWRRMLESRDRGGAHLAVVRRIVEEEGLPAGLALLPAIESGYRQQARGPRGSRGLWQFGTNTARHYGLVVSGARDDRLSVELSTRAAMRHLRHLYHTYGTWPLALAAYNAGEGRVRHAIDREGGATFWTLARMRRLPGVTRKYVPKFLALVRVMNTAGACPPSLPTVVATAE